ncbi:Threonylcarbamoyl-AMP synthase [Lecanosticta acicola]|uniref:Threonylcarbamoyl-AMP synthase n=1 Tax=Lecanosticta acicola TaxID=111012 RepID=A0AAI8Z3M0_9PEZI|nr:Threonylcarbamoyl-AMP synthase [Lecanosticta acicola]
METRTLPVDASKIGEIVARPNPDDILDELSIQLDVHSADAQYLRVAAEKLRSSHFPVAFPTETVYGLGADATRSDAVKGIYKAKQRPSDNPLIVHFASLRQLRSLYTAKLPAQDRLHENGTAKDPIPDIYKPLISRFWPGPLTIIMPTPKDSPLAPEVTAGLTTFGARMPRHVLALALIDLAGVPVAAPSANASTKPSPTAAEHVAYDLDGRIEIIIDGGPCDVGVESTVVDGLSSPPAILRPGGISLEQIRSCPGWEHTHIGYKNLAESESQPRAPGMKYRHYSPKATVVLFESNKAAPAMTELSKALGPNGKIGIVRTKSWTLDQAQDPLITQSSKTVPVSNGAQKTLNDVHAAPGFAGMLTSVNATAKATSPLTKSGVQIGGIPVQVLDIDLGPATSNIARGIFSALRDLDREGVDTIFVEGIDDSEGDTAAAIMNRLRKAAEVRLGG